jgi:hypothetical protein
MATRAEGRFCRSVARASPETGITGGCRLGARNENLGAGNEARTRDLNLGKVALYQLSYSRPKQRRNCRDVPPGVKENSAQQAAKALNWGLFP